MKPDAPKPRSREGSEWPVAGNWRARLLAFLDSGHRFSDEERGLSHRHRFINTVFLTATIVVSLFGLWRLASGSSPMIAAMDLLFAALASGLMIGLRRSPKTAIDTYATLALAMCFMLFGTVYVIITDAARSGPFLLIIASAFFLKGPVVGYRWSIACVVLMLSVELLPVPYAKGTYATLTSVLDIVCLILLLRLYESQKLQDAAALRSEEEKYRALFDASNDAVLLLENGAFVQWNACTPAFFRCPPETLVGRSLPSLLSPDNPRELGEALEAAEHAARERRSAPLELMLRRADGTDFYASVRLMPVAIGGKTLVQAIVRDIDARKRSEIDLSRHRDELEQRVRERTQRLEESELRFARLLELTEEGIFVHENGIIVDVTNAFCRMTGYVKHELIGRDFIVLMIPPERRPTVQEYIAAAGIHKYELAIMRADGSLIDVEAFGRPVDIGGRPLRAGVWRDVTARKETERHLLQARQNAEEATRAKSAFIANMSHEIRTPLNAIIGITHLLQREIGDLRQRDRLDRVADAARHLLTILSDILDISKIEAGKLTLESLPFSVRELIASVENLSRDNAAQKGLRLRILSDERIPPVLVGDVTRLLQVLLNFVSNSVKFTERGTVTLWISVIAAGAGIVTLRFRVSDTGIGMSVDQQSRLFRDFEQAESSITRRYGGTGLGLSISRRLVELMGGQIQVRSEPGTGSDFWFEITLPVSGVPLTEVERHPDETAADDIRRQHAGARILLVEDTPVNCEVAIDLLGEAGLAVDVAENGKQAIDKVRAAHYDLVLMDLQMPIMDGFQSTREIRRLPEGHLLPIIAMTANAYAEDRAQALAAGMNDYLSKPIEAPLLYAAIGRWLPPPTTEAETRAAATAPPPRAPSTLANDARAIVEQLAETPGFTALRSVTLAQRKPERYLILLARLFSEHGRDGARIRQMLASERPEALEEARRLTHTLKGVAATFGMAALSERAAELHLALNQADAERAAWLTATDDIDAALTNLATSARRIAGWENV